MTLYEDEFKERFAELVEEFYPGFDEKEDMLKVVKEVLDGIE